MPVPEKCSALVIGPGLAAADLPEFVREFTVRAWRESPLAIVVDASALEWLPAGPTPEKTVRVITPHPGEAGKMLQKSVAAAQENRAGVVRELSQARGNCFVALKGHQTMIGRGRGTLYVNCSGNPHLAQGGSGDLLTGYLGGLLAQPPMQEDPLGVLRYGVWQHGAAADLLQAEQPNWTIEELADRLGAARAL